MSEESDESKSRYWPKTLFWAKFGPKWTKFGPGKFFYAPGPPVSARYHYCLSEYAKSAKSNEANSRKWPKTSFWAQIWDILPKFGPGIFFFRKSGFVTLNRL